MDYMKEHLTDKKYVDEERKKYQKHLAAGGFRDYLTERYLKLAAYEDTGLSPEDIQEVVDIFDELLRCDIPEEIKSWAERCVWHVGQCDKLRKELANISSEKRKLEAELSIAKRDIAAIIWLNGECRYCAHAKKISYSGAEQYRCSLGSVADCRPEWNGGCT